jgi:hypothetical protein
MGLLCRMKDPGFQRQTVGTGYKLGHGLSLCRWPQSQPQAQPKTAAAQELKQVHSAYRMPC